MLSHFTGVIRRNSKQFPITIHACWVPECPVSGKIPSKLHLDKKLKNSENLKGKALFDSKFTSTAHRYIIYEHILTSMRCTFFKIHSDSVDSLVHFCSFFDKWHDWFSNTGFMNFTSQRVVYPLALQPRKAFSLVGVIHSWRNVIGPRPRCSRKAWSATRIF